MLRSMDVSIRKATPADAAVCGRIYYEGFKAINEKHGFPLLFVSPDVATTRIERLIRHPAIFALAAALDGKVVGFCILNEWDAIRGLGPIVIDVAAQGLGIGRRLMTAALDRAEKHDVRLLQDSFNMQSLSLYASLGFDAREAFIVMSGIPQAAPMPEYEVRRMSEIDLARCEALQMDVLGFSRINELRNRFATGTPIVALRDGQLRAYVANAAVWLGSHAVAKDESDMRALIVGAYQLERRPISFLLPIRAAGFFRWVLRAGLKADRPYTLMTMGSYEQPSGLYFPSVTY